MARENKIHRNIRKIMRRRNNGWGKPFELSITQLNQRKCKGCSDYINEITCKKEYFIHLGQEPYGYKGKVKGLDTNHQVLQHANGCRAYIYGHKFLPLMFDSERSDNDTCTALWITKDLQVPKVQLISSYWDITEKDIPQMLCHLVRHGLRHNNKILIGMDSNAHTDLTGSSHTEDRGSKLEQFILQHYLIVLNRGTEHTFLSHVGSSIIDITLSTPKLADKINNWKVTQEINHSDHKTIKFDISTPEPIEIMRRNYGNLDKERFRDLVEERAGNWKIPVEWTLGDIETQAEQGSKIINEVLDILIPYERVKLTPTLNRRWTKDLERKRRM